MTLFNAVEKCVIQSSKPCLTNCFDSAISFISFVFLIGGYLGRKAPSRPIREVRKCNVTCLVIILLRSLFCHIICTSLRSKQNVTEVTWNCSLGHKPMLFLPGKYKNITHKIFGMVSIKPDLQTWVSFFIIYILPFFNWHK